MSLPYFFRIDWNMRTPLSRFHNGAAGSLPKTIEIEPFAAELVDRFGTLPVEVKHLLAVVQIKGYCRKAGISHVEAGPKGAVITFRGNSFANTQGLVTFIGEHQGVVKLQKDHKLVFKADWDLHEARLAGVRNLVRQLADIAGQGKKAA